VKPVCAVPVTGEVKVVMDETPKKGKMVKGIQLEKA
jgi:hypothetical protein